MKLKSVMNEGLFGKKNTKAKDDVLGKRLLNFLKEKSPVIKGHRSSNFHSFFVGNNEWYWVDYDNRKIGFKDTNKTYDISDELKDTIFNQIKILSNRTKKSEDINEAPKKHDIQKIAKALVGDEQINKILTKYKVDKYDADTFYDVMVAAVELLKKKL